MKEQEIKVLMISPGQRPTLTTLKNELRALQEAVSIGADDVGYIEIIGIDDACLLLNEEGKLIGLPPNRRFYQDILCGVFYVVGEDGEGNLTSLSQEMIERYTEYFWEPEKIDPDEISKTIHVSFYPFERS